MRAAAEEALIQVTTMAYCSMSRTPIDADEQVSQLPTTGRKRSLLRPAAWLSGKRYPHFKPRP